MVHDNLHTSEAKIDVSIIIVTYNTERITYECIASIYRSVTKYRFEIIVVDNNSHDETVSLLTRSFNDIIVIQLTDNLGFSKGNNIGIKRAQGNYMLLLNSDTILFEDSIEKLLDSVKTKKYDICGPVLLNEDKSIQRSWFDFPSLLKTFLRFGGINFSIFKNLKSLAYKYLPPQKRPAFLIEYIQEDRKMDYLSFACILIKKEVIDKMGLLDEELKFYHEDCEYGLRARKYNYDIVYSTSSRIIHLGGTTSSNFSIFAFENDIRGLLHVFGKYYSSYVYSLLKFIIFLNLQWRIIFWHLGFFRGLNKIHVYNNEHVVRNKDQEIKLLNKYVELKKLIFSLKKT